jgi:hypothetical protein
LGLVAAAIFALIIAMRFASFLVFYLSTTFEALAKEALAAFSLARISFFSSD